MTLADDDIRAIFNDDFPAALAQNPEKARTLGALTYVFEIEDVGTWTLSCKEATCVESEAENYDCKITMAAADFTTLYSDPKKHAMRLFFAQKIVLDGDPKVATKLGALLELVRP